MGSRRILLISRYQDVIYDFLNAMGENEMGAEIDTVTNGTDAIKMLYQHRYQIVVTGLSLDGHNGEQIITYLNKNFPHVVCIIYASSISAAQLYFFINERNVFRVFLRPVNFQGAFLETLEEAFEYYEARLREDEEAVAREEEYEQHSLGITSYESKLNSHPQALREMNRYMRNLTLLTLREYGGLTGKSAAGIAPQEAEKLVRRKKLEWEAVDLCCRHCKQAEEYVEQIGQAEKIVNSLDGPEEPDPE